jgi:hypothetical protein
MGTAVRAPQPQQGPRRGGVAMSLRFLQSTGRGTGLVMSIVAICTVANVGCGGGGNSTAEGTPTPTAPSTPRPAPTPAASVTLDGNGQLTACESITVRVTRCDFSESGRNTGPGCAKEVRGTVALVSGEMDVVSQRWFLQASRVLMPDEQFTHTIRFDSAPDNFKQVTGYRAAVQWANTPCP